MDTRSIINPDEDGIFQQWKALHYIECDLSSKTILDTDGQAFLLSRVSFLIEGNIPKFLDAMGVDDHGNINTKEARHCAANILADRPWEYQRYSIIRLAFFTIFPPQRPRQWHSMGQG